ncbi:alpha/beta fold hydrolase, partial [Acinetobacter baumannii]
QALADWNARVQWFVSRGWAVLAPNARGSTGHGRAYTQALAGRRGDRDVADVAAGVRHALKEGWGDPRRVAVMGGSAGGMTALLLAARHP